MHRFFGDPEIKRYSFNAVMEEVYDSFAPRNPYYKGEWVRGEGQESTPGVYWFVPTAKAKTEAGIAKCGKAFEFKSSEAAGQFETENRDQFEEVFISNGSASLRLAVHFNLSP